MLKEKIIELRIAGHTIDSIVSILMCSKGTVSYHINKVGLECSKKINDNIIEEINEYLLSNTILETAKHFNL